MIRLVSLLVPLLVLNACAVARPTPPPLPLDPIPAEDVLPLASGTLPTDAVFIATFAPPTGAQAALPDTELLRYYTVRAGQRGANRVVVHRVNGSRVVRAYYLRIPTPVVAQAPRDSADEERGSGGSSAAPATGGPVQVRGYYRRDGTYVRPHTRSRPGSRARPGGGSRSGGRRRG